MLENNRTWPKNIFLELDRPVGTLTAAFSLSKGREDASFYALSACLPALAMTLTGDSVTQTERP